MEAGFAVVDVETTGLFPGSHRVAEIAIVHMDPEGNVTDRWETLVNPQRDLGPQRIHGIRTEEILEAPTFADIAPSVVQRLKGRVMVAHNLQFDYRFVSHELSLAGHKLPLGVEHVSVPCDWRASTCQARAVHSRTAATASG
jgi:DNA polymerase-3 subunit epsilon